MEILRNRIDVGRLKSMAEETFGNFVKAVVDVRRRLIAVNAELHADEEALLLEDGSRQQDLWGINLYPEFGRESEDFIEYDSMINLRPAHGNTSRGVDDPAIRRIIAEIVREWII